MLAHEQAAEHYDRALQALRRLEPPDDAVRCELSIALGSAQARTGRVTAARESFMTAAGIARTAGTAEGVARASLGLATVTAGRVPFGMVDTVLVGLLEESLAALGDQDSPLRARLMARLAQALSV